MGIRNRVIEIAYKLRDQFSGRVSKVTGSFRDIERQAERTDAKIGRLSEVFGRLGKSAKAAGVAVKATVVGAFAALGARLLGAISSIGQFRQELDATAKAARALGETTENLSALQYAAQLSGLELQQLTDGLQQMVRATSEAADGAGGAAEAVGELGLNAAELEKLRPVEQLSKIADALADVQNQADKVRIAEALFGGGNARGFLTLLEKGSRGLEEMAQAAAELGVTYSAEEAAKVEEFNDRLARLDGLLASIGKRLKLAAVNAGNGVLDAMGVAPGTRDRLQEINDEIDRLKNHVQSLRDRPTAIPFLFGDINDAVIRKELEKIKRLETERNKLLDQRAAQDQAAQREREHNRRMARLYKQGTESFKAALAERKAAYSRSLHELQLLQAQEKAIAEEFSQFVRGLVPGREGGEGLSFFNAGLAKSEAQRALNTGDFDAAIEKARAAKEMIQRLKEEGESSSVALLGLAKAVERIANAAAAGKTKAKRDDVEQQKRVIDDIERRLKNLPKVRVQFDEQALAVEMDRIQALLDRRPLKVRVETPPVIHWANDQSSVERVVEEVARRRGDR